MPMEDTYGIQSRIGSIIVVERWYCCRGSPVFSDRNIHSPLYLYLHIFFQFVYIQIRMLHRKYFFLPLNLCFQLFFRRQISQIF